MKTFEIRARDLIDYTVTIDAETAEEALEKFRDGDWKRRDEHEHERHLYDGGEAAVEVTG